MLPFLGIQLIYVAIAILKIEIIHNNVDNVKELNGCYDYIVVGLGSAGAVVANRLAEDKNNRVLGIDAGIPQSALTDIPTTYPLLWGSVYDWSFTTVPQNRLGQAYAGRRFSQPRGKAIGGSSVINGMVFNRGNRKDYDNWANTYGAIGWDYSSVLKYFIKFENNSDSNIVRENPGFHGTEGPVGISSPNPPDPILVEALKACNSLGFKTTDLNGAQQYGTAINQMFTKNGLRSSTSNSYLEPNPYPNNLFISIESFVTKILFENLTAIGVEFIKSKQRYRVYATKEVIISAGAIQSPQILMLSGIGPKEHLNQFAIPVIKDLPVGINFKDHPAIVEIYAIANDCNEVPILIPTQLTLSDLYQLYSNKSGILSQFPMATTYFSTKYNDDNSWPNTGLQFLPQKFADDFTPMIAKFDPSIQNQWKEYYSQLRNKCTLTLYSLLERPKSFGTIRLNSTDPFDPPLIDPNSLSNTTELDDFVEVVRLGFIVLETTTLSNHVTLPKLPVPGCSFCPNKPIHKCDQYIKCLIKQIGMSCCHQCCSCRMGSLNRSDVVVSERLVVKGIKNLRVCDASIMPEITNSNTNSASIMIGEHCSDLIKTDHKY